MSLCRWFNVIATGYNASILSVLVLVTAFVSNTRFDQCTKITDFNKSLIYKKSSLKIFSQLSNKDYVQKGT